MAGNIGIGIANAIGFIKQRIKSIHPDPSKWLILNTGKLNINILK